MKKRRWIWPVLFVFVAIGGIFLMRSMRSIEPSPQADELMALLKKPNKNEDYIISDTSKEMKTERYHEGVSDKRIPEEIISTAVYQGKVYRGKLTRTKIEDMPKEKGGGTKHFYEGKLYYQEHLKEEDVKITDRFPDDET